jgi:hypothetical protein
MRVAAFALGLIWLFAAGCTPSGDRATYRAPDRESFSAVSPMLEAHCGTLDCHGQEGRSLRLWNQSGMRLSSDDVTGDGGTREAEVDANYASVITIEPEILDAVVRDHGANPERLTLVRKARGSEHHKGGSAISQGSPADQCLSSWLAGAVDQSACDDPHSTKVVFPDWPN